MGSNLYKSTVSFACRPEQQQNNVFHQLETQNPSRDTSIPSVSAGLDETGDQRKNKALAGQNHGRGVNLNNNGPKGIHS